MWTYRALARISHTIFVTSQCRVCYLHPKQTFVGTNGMSAEGHSRSVPILLQKSQIARR